MKYLIGLLTILLCCSCSIASAQQFVNPIYKDASGTAHSLADENGILKTTISNPGTGTYNVKLASETIGLLDVIEEVNQSVASVTDAIKSPPSAFSSGYLTITNTPTVISPIPDQKTFRVTVIDSDIATWAIYVYPGTVATIDQSIPVWQHISRDWGVATVAIITSDTAKIFYELEAK